MIKIAADITQLIGNTPLVNLTNLSEKHKIKARLLGKLEMFNPMRSVKDRIAMSMIVDAEERGILTPDTVIIEPTSGNTGIGLAYIAAIKGYNIILTMPDTMSIERRNLLKAFGAKVVLTPGRMGIKGAIDKANELQAEMDEAIILQQFQNPANPAAHRSTTAQEIWRDTDGKIDIFVAGVGTGGTITGVGEALKEHSQHIKIVAVEPANSAVISGGNPGPHQIQGIGAGFVPPILNVNIIDEIILVENQAAFSASRDLVKTEGILAGISSGAALSAAISLGKKEENQEKIIVVLLPDTGERYLTTTLFN